MMMVSDDDERNGCWERENYHYAMEQFHFQTTMVSHSIKPNHAMLLTKSQGKWSTINSDMAAIILVSLNKMASQYVKGQNTAREHSSLPYYRLAFPSCSHDQVKRHWWWFSSPVP